MFFREEFSYLSNFYPSRVFWKGVGFPTVEHGYGAAKTHDHDIIKKISKLPGNRAALVKKMGKKFYEQGIQRIDWHDMKLHVMEDLLTQKFRGSLLEKLLRIKTIIIEDNRWHDNFWGRCNCYHCSSKPHENNLGKLIMKIRKSHINLNLC